MNNLVVKNINDRLYVNSREVAQMVRKDHDKLLRDIRKYKETLDNNNLEHSPILASPNFFVPATYKNSQNRDRPCYLLTKKGCDMVANKMTGDKGA
ncbi:Rha family transcriptional regulator [Clostridium baratii]|uniref:Rha family transcriptional regulator n=1 Tax=Clostridium baratii TaxID=1561 RepID=UPI0030D40B5E